MNTQTAEVELPEEKKPLVLKLIGRANQLGDEIVLLQSILTAGGQEAREEQMLHDELDVVRDYREVTLERIAYLTLGDRRPPVSPDHPDHHPVGLGTLGEDE